MLNVVSTGLAAPPPRSPPWMTIDSSTHYTPTSFAEGDPATRSSMRSSGYAMAARSAPAESGQASPSRETLKEGFGHVVGLVPLQDYVCSAGFGFG